MTYEYAMSRVRDAIEKCEGNHLKAQRMLITWMEKDQSLLVGLMTPHVHSVVSFAVSHALQPQKAKMPKKIELDEKGSNSFGTSLVNNLKGSGGLGDVTFGQSAPRGAVNPPGKASKAHVDAMKTLASKSKSGKTKKD